MFKITVFALVLIGLIFAGYMFHSPYRRIQGQSFEDGFQYLEFYDAVYSEKRFDTLLVQLIRDNSDLHSINIVASYIYYKKKCQLIPILTEKCDILKSYPIDSAWYTQLSRTKVRESSRSMLDLNENICESAAKLLVECNEK